MKINIEHLSEKELIELNTQIVERLKFLESMRDHNKMMEFNVGEKVCFQPPGRDKQTGILVKYNKKTVSVITDSGERWNVSPHLLSRVQADSTETSAGEKVINIKNHKKKNA